jgi:hypothetical protein
MDGGIWNSGDHEAARRRARQPPTSLAHGIPLPAFLSSKLTPAMETANQESPIAGKPSSD